MVRIPSLEHVGLSVRNSALTQNLGHKVVLWFQVCCQLTCSKLPNEEICILVFVFYLGIDLS